MAKKQVVRKKTNVKKKTAPTAAKKSVKKVISKARPAEPAHGRLSLTKKSSKAAAPLQERTLQPKPVEPPPSREPLRKVIGAGNTVTIVPKPVSPAAMLAPTEPSAAPEPLPARAEVARVPKVAWTQLPQQIPAQTRFTIGMALRECENAYNSPFPLAKFISALPQEVCGVDFAIMLLGLEHGSAAIAELCRLDTDRIEEALSRGYSDLEEKFSSSCPEVYRKWSARLGGVGLQPESILEQYLVGGVDRDFQLTLGAVILKAIGRRLLLLSVH